MREAARSTTAGNTLQDMWSRREDGGGGRIGDGHGETQDSKVGRGDEEIQGRGAGKRAREEGAGVVKSVSSRWRWKSVSSRWRWTDPERYGGR